MNGTIINILTYFSRFVSKDLLEQIFIQPDGSKKQGYDEVKAEIFSLPDEIVIPEIGKFIVSINENFVSERIKNSNQFILFVEYGKFDVNHETIKGVVESLAVTVAHNLSDTNNDNLNELLLMDSCLGILDRIICRMLTEQQDLGFCQNSELVTSPVEYQVVDPKRFYGCGGWCAIFTNANTLI